MDDQTTLDLSPLFTKFQLRNLTLSNRFIMPAMQRELAPGGVPSTEMAEYYCRRFAGGVALIIGEATAVDHPSATHYWKYARIAGPALDGWKRVLDRVKRAKGKIFVQLWHQGAVRKEGEGPDPDAPTLSPSGLHSAGKPIGKAMTTTDLASVKDAFVRGAQIALELGFDGLEIHGAHGYLLDQFFWSETNIRTDEYGGSELLSRARYPCEVVAAVRAAVGPHFPISFRFSQWKERDFDARVVHTPEELRQLLGVLSAAGVDVFHASTRKFWIPEFEGSTLGLAGWTKSLTDAAVITVGSVGLDKDIMQSMYGEDAMTTGVGGLEELVRRFRNGEFDLVAAGRAILGDADWVQKVSDGNFRALSPFLRKELAFLT